MEKVRDRPVNTVSGDLSGKRDRDGKGETPRRRERRRSPDLEGVCLTDSLALTDTFCLSVCARVCAAILSR